MFNHILGEDLKVGSVLTWGPGFDYQKQFFQGATDKTSFYPYTLRYDVEVSGFGSHRSGHLVLLRLNDMMYPGGNSSDHWPTLGLNTLKWAQKQGAVCGPAHSGYGITLPDYTELPDYRIPPYNSIGANEYIVDVTHMVEGPDGEPVPAVDFISMGDTNAHAELNMWYHTLNCGFRTRISGETDFPCVTGARVGLWRSYVKLDNDLTYDTWCQGISDGSNYVSDGMSHILNFKVNNVSPGESDSEVYLIKPGRIKVSLDAAAWAGGDLPDIYEDLFIDEKNKENNQWGLKRALTGEDQMITLEIVVNGRPQDKLTFSPNQDMQSIEFDIEIERSSWVAARIFPSSHTNPVFVIIDNKPIRASRRSAEWCRDGVEQCWKSKEQFYDADEMDDAVAAYDHARKIYDQIIAESNVD